MATTTRRVSKRTKVSRRPAARSTGGSAARGKGPGPATLAGRLRDVAGPLTFREVGELTGTHPENARRYLQGGSVSLNFVRNFCRAFGVSADWLLEGRGQKNRA
jgi:helix-turn-helix protein